MIVEENLAVPAARTYRTTSVVPHRDDRRDFPSTGRAGVAESDEFGAWTTGEVVDVNSAVHRAADAADSGAHGVHAVFTVGVRIHDLASELDEFKIIRC